MAIGKKIEEIAEAKGINLKELSRKSNVSYNTLYAIVKRNNKSVRPDILQKIATTLGLSVDELVYGKSKDLLGNDMPTHKLKYYNHKIIEVTGIERQSSNIYRSFALVKLFHELKEECYFGATRNMIIFLGGKITILFEPLTNDNGDSNLFEAFIEYKPSELEGFFLSKTNININDYLYGNVNPDTMKNFFDDYIELIKDELINQFNVKTVETLYYRYPTFFPGRKERKIVEL